MVVRRMLGKEDEVRLLWWKLRMSQGKKRDFEIGKPEMTLVEAGSPRLDSVVGIARFYASQPNIQTVG